MRINLRYFLLIFFIFFAACIETDIYLPSFPDMMAFFDVDAKSVQQLLTWNFLGLCISGLFYGPISDAFGRRKPLLAALGIFLAGSILTVFADSFSWMLAGRVLQGIGSGGCFTLGTAILFDVFHEEKAIKVLNQMNMIVPFLLAGAPILGGCLNLAFGFKANFFLIAALVLFSFLICWFFFEETFSERKPFAFKKMAAGFRQVSCNASFWQLTCVISLLFAGYLAFLSQIPVLFVLEMQVSKELFPLYQASILTGYLLASISCSYAIAKCGVKTIKRSGLICIAVGVLSLLLCAVIQPTPFFLTLAMMPYSFGFIWLQTPYVAEVMTLMPEVKGIAASLLTSARLLITASIVFLASYFYNGTILIFALLLIAIFAVIVLAMFCYERQISAKSINPSKGST